MSRDSEFSAFVAARRTHLRRVAYACCGDWHRAEDLVQTSLVKLYVAWPRLHRDGREEAYARRIIVRADVDERRQPWRREESPRRRPSDRTGSHRPNPPPPVGPRGSRSADALFHAVQALPLQPSASMTVVLRH